MAGIWSSRFAEPPTRRMERHRVRHAGVGHDVLRLDIAGFEPRQCEAITAILMLWRW
jgi:hypothetical protein